MKKLCPLCRELGKPEGSCGLCLFQRDLHIFTVVVAVLSWSCVLAGGVLLWVASR